MCIPSGKVRSKLQALKHVPHTVNDIFDQYAGEKGVLNLEDVQQILKAQVSLNMVIRGNWGGGPYDGWQSAVLVAMYFQRQSDVMYVTSLTRLSKITGVSLWSFISTASRQCQVCHCPC